MGRKKEKREVGVEGSRDGGKQGWREAGMKVRREEEKEEREGRKEWREIEKKIGEGGGRRERREGVERRREEGKECREGEKEERREESNDKRICERRSVKRTDQLNQTIYVCTLAHCISVPPVITKSSTITT